MTPIIILSKKQQALFSYIIIGIFVINNVKKFLVVKIQLNNSKQINKFNSILKKCFAILYMYYVISRNIHNDKILFFYFFFNLLSSFSSRVMNFIFWLLIEFGFYFYIIFIGSTLKIFYYFFPQLVKYCSQQFFSFINISEKAINFYIQDLFSLINFLWITMFSFFMNYKIITINFLYIVEFFLRFVEYICFFAPLLIVKPFRDFMSSVFRGNAKALRWSNFLLLVNNYISKWSKTFHSYEKLEKKSFFVFFTLLCWLSFIISIIQYMLYIKRSILST